MNIIIFFIDNGKMVRVYEHLVGDATGCIILKSQQGT